MPLALKPYQVEGVEWLLQRERAILADEAGLGKSVQMLRAATEPVLVVAPAMVLNAGTWDDEVEKWAPGMDVTQVAYSSLAMRGERGKVERDSNGFPRTPPKPQYRGHWGTVIGDESHYIKGRKTSWANAFLDLRADQLMLATGTPIPNWAHEAFMILRALFPEEARAGRKFGSYWRWAGEWFEISMNHFNAREIGDLHEHLDWEQFREENWGDRFLRRLRDDVLTDLPPLTRQRMLTPMSREQGRVYRALKKDLVAWLDSGSEISVWSEPGLLVKLAKLATSLDVLDPSQPPSGKMTVLASLLEDRPRQTLVVGHFQSTIEASVRAAHRAGKTAAMMHGRIPMSQRAEAVRSFQRGEVDVLCASIGTVSEGMTLHQGGADQVIRVERSARPSSNEQTVRRLHRIGQLRPVHCIDLVTPNSYDERLETMLQEKTDQQMEALGETELRLLV